MDDDEKRQVEAEVPTPEDQLRELIAVAQAEHAEIVDKLSIKRSRKTVFKYSSILIACIAIIIAMVFPIVGVVFSLSGLFLAIWSLDEQYEEFEEEHRLERLRKRLTSALNEANAALPDSDTGHLHLSLGAISSGDVR